MALEIDKVVEGKVKGITKYGAFVELEGGKVGLVHISEVSNVFVKDINEYVKEGETVKVKILKIEDNGKIELSMKQAKEANETKKYSNLKRDIAKKQSISTLNNFEEMISKFNKLSAEKLSAFQDASKSKRRRSFNKNKS